MSDAAHKWSDEELHRINRRLKAEYTTAAKELTQKNEKFMKSYSSELSQRLKALDNSQEAQEAFDNWCRGQAVLMSRNEQMIKEYAALCTNANIASTQTISGSLPGVFAENYNFAARDVSAKTGVSFFLVNEKAVKRLVEKQPKLLPDPKVDIPKDMRWNQQKMTSAVTQGVLQGESSKQIAKRLQRVVGMNQRSAMSAARTAVTGAENAGRMEMFKDAEDMGLNIVKVWMATADGRTRESHLWINGEEKPLDKEFSNGCMFPGDPNGEPGEVINCRCSMGNQIDRSGRPKGFRAGSGLDASSGYSSNKEWLSQFEAEVATVFVNGVEVARTIGTPNACTFPEKLPNGLLYENADLHHTHTTPVSGTFSSLDVATTTDTFCRSHTVEHTLTENRYRLQRTAKATRESAAALSTEFSEFYTTALGEAEYQVWLEEYAAAQMPLGAEGRRKALSKIQPKVDKWLRENVGSKGYLYFTE